MYNNVFTCVCLCVLFSTPPQLQETSEREKINEKYPSFELVLNFVRTDSLSVDQVHSLLEERSDMARTVAQGYNYCADVVKTLGVESLFEVCSKIEKEIFYITL